jgi:hypothetical protein
MCKPRPFSLVLALILTVLSTPHGSNVGAQAPAAQTPAVAMDTSLFAGLRWRSIGPVRGGRSQAVAGSAARPLEYYFGATGGGVWKTTDGGQTWRSVSDRTFTTSSVGAIAVAASNPDVVYVGMGETELRGNIIQGDGVYKSSDGGKTWSHVGLEKTMAIARIYVHPTNPDVVFVAALGNPYGANPERGVFRSRDGGKTWERVLFRDEKTGAVDLARRLVCRALGSLPHAAFALERRAGQRTVQERRRRHDVDRVDEEQRAAAAALGQDRRLGLGRGSESRLRDHRSQSRRGIPLGRRRADLEVD